MNQAGRGIAPSTFHETMQMSRREHLGIYIYAHPWKEIEIGYSKAIKELLSEPLCNTMEKPTMINRN